MPPLVGWHARTRPPYAGACRRRTTVRTNRQMEWHVSRSSVFILFQVNLLQADGIMAKHRYYTGLRVSELIGFRWNDVHHDSIAIDERCCRGDWGAPKSDASNDTIPVNRAVIERILRLKTLTVEVRAGMAT